MTEVIANLIAPVFVMMIVFIIIGSVVNMFLTAIAAVRSILE